MAAEPTAVSPRAAHGTWWYAPALVGAALVAAYWPTLASLNSRWAKFDEAYSHGYLVVGMVGYFIWLQADRIRRAAVHSDTRAVVVLAGLSVVWALSQIVDVQLAGALLLPFVLLAAVYALYGRAVAAIVAFPLLLSYVAIPLWDDLFATPLRQLSTWATMVVLDNFADFPAHRDGFAIAIPEGVFYVADQCSGLSFFLTGITIGLGYGYLNIDGVGRRALFFVICVALSIVSNWVRVASLIYIGHYTHMQSSLVTEGHLTYGWFVFAAAMLVMLAIGYRMSAPLPETEPAGGGDASIPASTPSSGIRMPIAVAGAMLIAPALVFALQVLPSRAVAAPALPSEFTASAPSSSDWRGYFQGASSEIAGVLSSDPALRVVGYYYANQQQDAELVNDNNRLFSEPDWVSVQRRQLSASDVEGLPHPVIEQEFSSPTGSRVLAWHWNDLGGYPSTGRLHGKISQLRAALLAGRSDGTFFALTLGCGVDCDAARARMRELAPRHIAAFERASATDASVASTAPP